jgi:hypothetical protein
VDVERLVLETELRRPLLRIESVPGASAKDTAAAAAAAEVIAMSLIRW